jgi:hypothetical protein
MTRSRRYLLLSVAAAVVLLIPCAAIVVVFALDGRRDELLAANWQNVLAGMDKRQVEAILGPYDLRLDDEDGSEQWWYASDFSIVVHFDVQGVTARFLVAGCRRPPNVLQRLWWNFTGSDKVQAAAPACGNSMQLAGEPAHGARPKVSSSACISLRSSMSSYRLTQVTTEYKRTGDLRSGPVAWSGDHATTAVGAVSADRLHQSLTLW